MGVSTARVLHFPDWRAGNPYQRLFAEALAKAGVHVVFATYVGALFPLFRAVWEHKTEVLHVHWIAEIQGADEPNALKYLFKQAIFRLDVWLVHLKLRGRIVWTVHNLTAHESRHPRGDLAARRFLARRAAHLFAHGPAARDAVIATYGVLPERVSVVPHGNFIGVYPNQCTRAESRLRLGIPEDRFVFLHLGILRPYKGLEDLLDSYERLVEPRKCLVVAGRPSDDGYAQGLRKRCSSPGILFEGRYLGDDELQFFYNAADAVVLPFKSVLTSSSLMLAMSFGRLVIAPRLGCVPDYADPEGSILYAPGQADELDGALAAALSRDVEAAGRHNLERARRFEWREASAKTATVYADLFSNSPGRAT